MSRLSRHKKPPFGGASRSQMGGRVLRRRLRGPLSPKRGTSGSKVRHTFPPGPQVLPQARLCAGFLKGPRAREGGGASRGAEPGPRLGE